MLTKKQNLLEVMKGGNPDRFVKQYEAFNIILQTPMINPMCEVGGDPATDLWGVTRIFAEGSPGPFPMHDDAHLVIKDIENWQDYVHAPKLNFTAADWEPVVAQVEAVDRDEQFVLPFVAPGVFEQCHALGEITNVLMYLYEEPEKMKELIKYITEWELELADQFCTYLKPDGVFHHDDWGTQISTFMSPDMFAEFFLDSYKEIYGFYKSHGAELIVHHSDTYGATLVPYMIEMGINVWQGVMTTNDVPALIKQYGPQITFMGDIDSGVIDRVDWSPEVIEREVRRACEECGKLYFIPNASQGMPISTFPGVYETIDEKIDLMSKEMF